MSEKILQSSLKNAKFENMTAEQVIKKYEEVLYSRERQIFELSSEIGQINKKIQKMKAKCDNNKEKNIKLKNILQKKEVLLKQELDNKELMFMQLTKKEKECDEIQQKIKDMKENKKIEKKEETTLFSYSLFYKVMNEHFKFLNYIKVILGINIPFVVDIDNIANKTMNSSEGLLEININNFFEKLLTNKCKYPFEYIYKTICDDNFKSFNIIRKTIKHESILAMNKYVKK